MLKICVVGIRRLFDKALSNLSKIFRIYFIQLPDAAEIHNIIPESTLTCLMGLLVITKCESSFQFFYFKNRVQNSCGFHLKTLAVILMDIKAFVTKALFHAQII